MSSTWAQQLRGSTSQDSEENKTGNSVQNAKPNIISYQTLISENAEDSNAPAQTLLQPQSKTIGIVGSRNFTDYSLFCKHIKQWEAEHGKIDVIVSGGAKGADSLAEQYALQNSRKLILHPAEWKKYGAKAGPLRNTLIVRDSDCLIAFPTSDSKGTWDSVTKAKQSQKPVFIFNV